MGVFPVPIRPPGALSGHLCDPCHICASLLLPLVLADVSAGIAWGLASACPRCTLCCFGTAQQGVCLYCPTAASGLGWSCCPGFMFVVQRGQRSSAFTRTCVWLPNVNTHTPLDRPGLIPIHPLGVCREWTTHPGCCLTGPARREQEGVVDAGIAPDLQFCITLRGRRLQPKPGLRT